MYIGEIDNYGRFKKMDDKYSIYFFLLDKFIGKKQSLGNKLKLKFSTFGYMLVF